MVEKGLDREMSCREMSCREMSGRGTPGKKTSWKRQISSGGNTTHDIYSCHVGRQSCKSYIQVIHTSHIHNTMETNHVNSISQIMAISISLGIQFGIMKERKNILPGKL